MTGYQSKKKAASAKTIDQVNWVDHEPDGLVHTAQDKLELVDYEKLAALGWQAIECPFCGSSGAQAFPKPVAQPAQEPELLRDAVFAVLEGFTLPHDVRKILEAAYYAAPLQPAQEPQTCKGRKCQASNENGFDHSPECIADTARDQGWSTAPPQRPWIGLTPEETTGFTQHEMSVVKYVSKVLMEKNG